jgi:Fe-S cluster biogenesis protein NfuA
MSTELENLLRDVLAPLVEADGGSIELVSATATEVVVRLGRACAGCPGAPYTTTHVVEPAIRRIAGAEVAIRFERAPANVATSP